MTILHIAALNNSPYSGVSVVVPEHVKAQERYANVALVNILDYEVDGVRNQLDYQSDITCLPEPFNKPDIVIFHQLYYTQYLTFRKSLKKEGIPYVIVPHGCLSRDALKIKRIKKIIGNAFLFNPFIKKALALQCLSEGEAFDINFNLPKIISTNGYNIPHKKKELFVSDGSIKIVYIGRLEIYHKGLDILIDALCRVKNLLLERKVFVNMYGPDNNDSHNKIRNLIRKNNLTDIISINHGITGKEKEDVLLRSDLFIQTSRFEGMPMGILEAMSYGLPVLITKGTTLGKRVLKYNAGWVAETSVDSVTLSLTDAINSVVDYKKKSEAARTLVIEEFDWSIIAKNAIEQYCHLINKN